METSCKNLVKENYDWKADGHGSNQQMSGCGAVARRDTTMEEVQGDEPLSITEMPDSIFLYIFSYLPFSSIGSVAQVCPRWCQISTDELLWKEIFLRHYKLSLHTKLPAKADSWRSEFKRLYYHTPCLLSEERKEHRDEVLHVSFSHDGTMFATCSKDGFFKVWECGQPCRLLFEKDMMSSFSWKFTQFSQFNESDTCLLVSGVYFGCSSTSGEIAVFNLQDDFNMQCRVTNKPYDVFGTWYDNDHLLSGTLYWTGDFNSVSAVWLSKASQEVESEMESVSMVLYRFENRNSSSIRLLHVAEVERDDDDTSDHERSMEHSPIPCRMPHSASGEPRESTLVSSSPALMTTDSHDDRGMAKSSSSAMDVSAGRRVDASVGGDEMRGGCETRLLDKLLKKNIAENEFDLENEDDTDVEEVDENDDGLVGARKETDEYHGGWSDNSLTSQRCDGIGSCDCASYSISSFPRGCCENENKHGLRENTDLVDSIVDSVGVNVNFISFGEPQPSLPSSSHWDTKRFQDFHEESCDSCCGEQAGGSHKPNRCQDVRDMGKSELSSLHDKSGCSCGGGGGGGKTSSEGGESNHNNSGSAGSSKELTGGLDALGINNADLSYQACGRRGSLMEEEEAERMSDDAVVRDKYKAWSLQRGEFSLLSASFLTHGAVNLQGGTDCNSCRGDKEGNFGEVATGGFDEEEGLSQKTWNTDDCDECGFGNTEIGGKVCHILHRKHSDDESDKIVDNDISDKTTPDNSTSNSVVREDNFYDTSRRLSCCDNDDNDIKTGFSGESFNDITSPGGDGQEASDFQKSLFSACNTKTMDNAATQTEESGASLSSSMHSSMAHMSHSMSHSSSLSREGTSRRATDKLLIYTWGSQTYIPHKIGIKRIKRSDFCKGEVKARQSSMLLPDVMENLHNISGEDRRDVPDVSIDMHGHIVGLSLSPDDRFLYVNCRAWPKNYIISDPQESPPLAQEVEIFTIDLRTFQFVGPVLRSHKAYTHSDECFFLNLDVSDDYVVSGAEDRKGYIWDRHYGNCLGQFEHRSVVNCMAVCPSDPEVAVSVSDDHTFKVWMSRRKLKEMKNVGKNSSRPMQ